MNKINYFAKINLKEKTINIYTIVDIMSKNILPITYDSTDEEIHVAIVKSGEMIVHLNNPNYSVANMISNGVKNFASLKAAAEYIKEQGISTAHINFIMSNINRNLDGKTKTAYGLKWEMSKVSLSDFDISDFKVYF